VEDNFNKETFMSELSPLHYRIAETPLFGEEPNKVVRQGTVYMAHVREPLDPRIAADEAVNRLKVGVDTDSQRHAIEIHIRPIIESGFGLLPGSL
jgi:hypothetical protein